MYFAFRLLTCGMKAIRKILLACATLLFLAAIYVLVYLNSSLPINDTADVYIPPQTSVSRAAALTSNAHIVRQPFLFKVLLRGYCMVSGGTVYAGAYRFSGQHSHWQVLKALLTGKQVFKVKTTFPEGINAYRFASILHKNIGIDSAEFIRLVFSDSVKKHYGIEAPSLEGYLMPETYYFYWKQPAADVLDFLINEQNKLWKERFEQAAIAQGKTRNEILSLASIVEAETPQADERARVAGVYSNRLNKGMKLDADPTVQYALGGITRRLTYNDLEIESPYNTYRKIGLPPGPINSPGASSIEAALHPESNSYIYFCAKGDGSNRHSFAVTSAEHQVNVLRYRKNRAAQ